MPFYALLVTAARNLDERGSFTIQSVTSALNENFCHVRISPSICQIEKKRKRKRSSLERPESGEREAGKNVRKVSVQVGSLIFSG